MPTDYSIVDRYVIEPLITSQTIFPVSLYLEKRGVSPERMGLGDVRETFLHSTSSALYSFKLLQI